MVFVFGSVYVVDYVYSFVYVEPALHPWDEAYLIVMDKLSMCCCNWFASILLKIFFTDIHYGYWPKVFLSSCVSARFWYQDVIGLIK